MGRRRSRTKRFNRREPKGQGKAKYQPYRPKAKERPRRERIIDLPPELRGPPQNRFGGYKTVYIEAPAGSTFGAANKGRVYTEEEKLQWARQHKDDRGSE